MRRWDITAKNKMKKSLCILSIFALMTAALGFSSCQQQNQPTTPTEPTKPTSVRVTNNTGSLALNSFTIKFFNRGGEQVGNKDFGDLNPGNSVSMNIPTGAVVWYVGAFINHGADWRVSPNFYFEDDIYNVSLSFDDVQQWMYGN